MRCARPGGMNVQELLLTAARALGVYILMLIVVRALGRRTVGNFSAFDLLVALMLGEIIDEMIFADVPFIQGTVAMVTIGGLTYADSLLSYWDHGMQKLLEGTPAIVIKNGDFHPPGMRRERMNEKDVLGALRLNGVRDVREVKYAVVEENGTISIIAYEWAERVMRADVEPAMAKARDRALADASEARTKRTDTPEALEHSPEDLR